MRLYPRWSSEKWWIGDKYWVPNFGEMFFFFIFCSLFASAKLGVCFRRSFFFIVNPRESPGIYRSNAGQRGVSVGWISPGHVCAIDSSPCKAWKARLNRFERQRPVQSKTRFLRFMMLHVQDWWFFDVFWMFHHVPSIINHPIWDDPHWQR